MNIGRKASALLGAAVLALGVAGESQAVVIGNGVIFLGVNADASLNDTSGVGPSGRTGIGLFDGRTLFEATYDGCTCEAWGAAAYGSLSNSSVWANTTEGGLNALNGSASITGFSTTGTFGATSVVDLIGDNPLRVVHNFAPSSHQSLYRVQVEITNTSSSLYDNVVYRRAMDWDIEPTPFDEYVTIGGVRNSLGILHENIKYSSNNGFATGNPLSDAGGSFVLTNFEDAGPDDHGAVFDFQFGALAAGETKVFNIFYGAALSETEAFSALDSVGAEIYSFGQSSDNQFGGPAGGAARSTFIFAFDIDNDGTAPDRPILPAFIDENGGFHFTPVVTADRPFSIDPDIAVGYVYEIITAPPGAYYKTLLLPDFLGDLDGYDVYDLSDNLIFADLMPMVEIDFVALGFTNLQGFKILDIDATPPLDPTDPTAFVTTLSMSGFTGSASVEITQTPIVVTIGGVVPEPATWAMMIGGLALVGATMRRRTTVVSFA